MYGRHDDETQQRETIAIAHVGENLHEEIPGLNGTEGCESPIVANEMFDHGPMKPVPSSPTKERAPETPDAVPRR